MQEEERIMNKEGSWIKNWAKEDQPREKLLDKGPQALTDAELLAILIRLGRPDRSALDLARELLDLTNGNMHELGKRPVHELMKVKGIGLSKAMSIAAALEIGRRRHSGMYYNKVLVNDSRKAAGYIRPLLMDHSHEVFGVLFLKPSGRIKHFEIISEGGITAVIADTRLILKKALLMESVSFIVGHNHPSGNLQPSKEDEVLTTKLYEGAKLLDIKLVDHIIVGESGYFSFADEGLLKK
jgi:DNA repair protein RadC